MKKYLAVGLGVLSLFTFTACGGDTNTNLGDDNNDDNNDGDNTENTNFNKTSIECVGTNGMTFRFTFNNDEVLSATNVTTGLEYSNTEISVLNSDVYYTVLASDGISAGDPMYEQVKYYGENAMSEFDEIVYTCE